jgi:hypothetical protein
MVVRSAHKL